MVSDGHNMVIMGHPVETRVTGREVRDIRYRPAPGAPAGLEVLDLAETVGRLPRAELAVPQRPEFHILLFVSHGRTRHLLDFRRIDLGPGSVLWVRPGQVQRWGDLSDVRGTVVLFRADFLESLPDVAELARDPECSDWTDTGRVLAAGVGQLRRVATDGRLPEGVRTGMGRHLLAAIVLELGHLAHRAGRRTVEPGSVFDRFRREVEERFAQTRTVADYARRLGYAPRTLARATRNATGAGAKEFIDARVVLEARRLLAQTELSVARVADRVGFADPANFVKFFARRAGALPSEFRASVRTTTT